jgi:Icc-related predicted phosphoesterase
MKLWILSDLHCELTSDWDLPGTEEPPDFDVLIVAGDLMPGMEKGVHWLAEHVKHKPVVYIAGNHEGYGNDLDETRREAKEAARGTNILVMENETIVIDGVRIVAGTLWTDFELFGDAAAAMHAAGTRMNDYRRIVTDDHARRLDPSDTLSRHRATVNYIEGELARVHDGPTVVVTHHAPYRGAVRLGHEQDILSAAYVSDLGGLIQRRQPDLWVYGHTHQSDDTRIGRTRIVSNAKGYGPHPVLRRTTWENQAFDAHFTVDVAPPGIPT